MLSKFSEDSKKLLMSQFQQEQEQEQKIRELTERTDNRMQTLTEDYKKELSTKTIEVNSLKTRITDLTATQNKHETERKISEASLLNLNEDKSKLGSRVDTLETQKQDLEGDVRTVRSEMTNLYNVLSETKESRGELKGEVKALTSQLNYLKETVKRLQDERDRLAIANDELIKHKSALVEQTKNFTDEREQLIREVEHRAKKHEEHELMSLRADYNSLIDIAREARQAERWYYPKCRYAIDIIAHKEKK